MPSGAKEAQHDHHGEDCVGPGNWPWAVQKKLQGIGRPSNPFFHNGRVAEFNERKAQEGAKGSREHLVQGLSERSGGLGGQTHGSHSIMAIRRWQIAN